MNVDMTQANNPDLRAKRLIAQMQMLEFDATDESVSVAMALTVVFTEHRIMQDREFPARSANLSDIGWFIHEIHDAMLDVMNNYSTEDLFVKGGGVPDVNHIRQFLAGPDGTPVEGAAELIQEMCVAWIMNNSQYADDRVKSVRKQLENGGFNQEYIDAKCSDPEEVRHLVHHFKQLLELKLLDIQRRLEAKDIKHPVNESDKALWARHKDWFLDQGVDGGDYMPNDGAVAYHVLFGEIVEMVVEQGVDDPYLVWEVVQEFFQIGHAHMIHQAARKGWDALKTVEDHEFNQVNVGEMWRTYTAEEDRVVEIEEKNASPLLRGPLRFMRMAAVVFGLRGTFTLYNADPSSFMTAAVRMRTTEKQVEELLKEGKFSAPGAEGFSVAMSATWAVTLDANMLFFARTGRNDLSVPKILSNIVDIDVSAYANLQAREWHLPKDIRGTKIKAPRIAEHFKAYESEEEEFEGDESEEDDEEVLDEDAWARAGGDTAFDGDTTGGAMTGYANVGNALMKKNLSPSEKKDAVLANDPNVSDADKAEGRQLIMADAIAAQQSDPVNQMLATLTNAFAAPTKAATTTPPITPRPTTNLQTKPAAAEPTKPGPNTSPPASSLAKALARSTPPNPKQSPGRGRGGNQQRSGNKKKNRNKRN